MFPSVGESSRGFPIRLGLTISNWRIAMRALIALSVLALLTGIAVAADNPDWAYPVTPPPESKDT